MRLGDAEKKRFAIFVYDKQPQIFKLLLELSCGIVRQLRCVILIAAVVQDKLKLRHQIVDL